MKRNISNANEIRSFLHCGRCLGELPKDLSPREWASIEAGFTKQGIQLWCKRHEINIMHMDFEGQKHPANTSARKEMK